MMWRRPYGRRNCRLVIVATAPQEEAIEMFQPKEWVQQARPEEAVCKTTKQSTEMTEHIFLEDTAEVCQCIQQPLSVRYSWQLLNYGTYIIYNSICVFFFCFPFQPYLFMNETSSGSTAMSLTDHIIVHGNRTYTMHCGKDRQLNSLCEFFVYSTLS